MQSLKFIVIFVFCVFLNTQLIANEKIVYVDMNKLMTLSEAGKSISNQLSTIHEKNLKLLKNISDNLKEEETTIIAQKNIIAKEEFQKKLIIFKGKADDYKNKRNEINKSINKKRVEATSKLLAFIQPILGEYANKNSISIIIQKKNIILGKTDLDITDSILKTLNSKHKKIKIK